MLKVGDFVNPLMRPAGVLIPTSSGRRGLQAGFGQIEAQVIRRGMAAEVTCVSKPLAVIPMVVTDVQDYIASGQFRAGEQLAICSKSSSRVRYSFFWSPCLKVGSKNIPPGSACIANAYTTITTVFFMRR